MTLPASALSDDQFAKSVLEARKAILRRFEKTGDARIKGLVGTVHEGRPSLHNLPQEDVGVWLHLRRLTPDPDAPFKAYYFRALWDFRVLIRDSGNDPHGFDPSSGIEIISSIIHVLVESFDDVSLDGAMDDTEILSIENNIGTPAGGDRQISEWVVSLAALHPIISTNRA